MLYHRDIIDTIKKVLFREEFIILTGARQTGKTSILIMLKAIAEEGNYQCRYFNLENPVYLEALNNHPYNLFDFIPDAKAKQYIFIDEIQYLNNPANFLKLLYDERRAKVKLIVSGSSSFYIDRKFKDSLTGRKFLFEVYPLNFYEFLTFLKEDDLLKQQGMKLSTYYREKLIGLWENYITFGGYPRIVLADEQDIKKIMIEEIGASYIKKDVADAGIKNSRKYFSMIRILASQAGGLVNVQEISNTLSLSHKTVEEYLYVMEKSYQIALIKPFSTNIRKELTKMPKVYFYDTGLRNYFLNDFGKITGRPDKGAYLENIFFRELLRKEGSADNIKFWRTQDKREVDFVVSKNAYEVKFSEGSTKKKNEYGYFREAYPDIKFHLLTYEDILPLFYGWKI